MLFDLHEDSNIYRIEPLTITLFISKDPKDRKDRKDRKEAVTVTLLCSSSKRSQDKQEMGVTTITQEFSSPISPSRMFKALIVESSKLIPQLLPQYITSVDVVQGDGGPGTIEQVNFSQASHFKYVKNRIDELNKEAFTCKYTMIEGDALDNKLDFIAYEIKFDEGSDGGCVCKMTSKYHTAGEFEIKEEDIKAGKDSAMGIYKAIEAYLFQNPHLYA